MATDQINTLLGRLARQPLDRSLAGLERDVGDAVRRQSGIGFTASVLAPLRLATLGLAMFIGIAVGALNGASDAYTSHLSLFDSAEKLTVTALLEGD